MHSRDVDPVLGEFDKLYLTANAKALFLRQQKILAPLLGDHID